MNFSAPKQQITPPAKGSFPLDHDGECKPLKVEFLDCLKEHGNEHINCKSISKRYLECRMNAGLMARDDLANVGFAREDTEKKRSSSPESKEEEGGGRDRVNNEGQRESQGFVAGLHIEERPSWNPFRPRPRGGH